MDTPYANRDWSCPSCTYKNFERNVKCRKCKTIKPATSSQKVQKDWKCDCGLSHPNNEDVCRECKHPRLKVEGDWWCENCQWYVFRSKGRCGKCRALRPDVAAKREAEGKGEDVDGKCLTCLSAKANMLIVRCKHISVCQECVQKIDGKCPICRQSFNVQDSQQVFNVFSV